MKAVVIMMIDH